MGSSSAIEWTDATWNPVTGCSHVSPGCEHCYAETLSRRRGWTSAPWGAQNAAANVVVHPERLYLPVSWRRPRRVFVNSMSDLFHERVSDEFIRSVFDVMLSSGGRRHIYQILTKRPERMRSFLSAPWWVSIGRDWTRHIWLGVSVEDQRRADERIPELLATPAAARFVSYEPALDRVDFTRVRWHGVDHRIDVLRGGYWDPAWGFVNHSDMGRLHWVICGGESGPHARSFNPDWARSVRDQCVAAGVPFFFKQFGGRTPKAGGRELDGRTWDEMPAIQTMEGV